MIYHCSFGDLDTAASIARTLVSRAASSSHSAASRTYLNASRAFMYAGLLSEGVTATELSYKSGIEAGLVRIPQQAAIGFEIDSTLMEEGQVHETYIHITANMGQQLSVRVVVDVHRQKRLWRLW